MVHTLPGRVRLRVPDGADGPDLAGRVAAHPAVRSARWSGGARSLAVQLDPAVPFERVLAELPERAPERAERRSGPGSGSGDRETPLWRSLLGPGVALAAGVAGVAPLSAPAIAAAALPIGRRALRSLGRRHVGIDVLDATAVTLLVGTGDLLAAGVSVALIEAGERIRKRARGGARHVLRGWMGGDSRGVRVMREGGSEPRVPVEEVAPGERAVVYAGEAVAVDGVVLTGEGDVDERTWTGEPLPRHVTEGDTVLAGSMVVDGRLVISVTATGDATRAGRLASALEEAIAANTHTTDTAKRIADRLVLPVLAAGGLVFLGTGDLQRLVSLLIVDFGTGIRIAVPTSILSTMVAGARQDVLFRSGRAIEELARVDTIIFDKTGTLTTGRPSVLGVVAENGWNDSEVLRLAAAAEGHLPHPLARAVRRSARRRGLELPEPSASRYRPGGGVEASIDGRNVLVGDPRLLAEHGISVPASATQSSSSVFVAVDGEVAGRIRLRDTVRTDAAETIAQLRNLGINRLWLATGDRAPAARSVARQLGLDGHTAQMMPEAKAELVRSLRAEGRRVAVVGDGINDAAAMAEADVAVAVPRGADLARETAEVVLSRDDLSTLVVAIRLARQAMGLVRENIALVTAPNAAALGMAAAGALTPLAATAVNNGSTLVAALNALRPLRRGGSRG